MQSNLFTTIRSLKFIEGCKASQVCALNSCPPSGSAGDRPSGVGEKILHDHLKANSLRSKPGSHFHPSVAAEILLPYGLPSADLVEPYIDPFLKYVDFVDTLADLYRRFEACLPSQYSDFYLEQCAVFRALGDPKLFRKSLTSARQHAIDAHKKVVLSAWIRYERREDDPDTIYDRCGCSRVHKNVQLSVEQEECSTSEEDADLSFCAGREEIRCNRNNIASLSRPFRTMLYGSFIEARREKINFTLNGISAAAMKSAELYSRTRRLYTFDPPVLLELLSFANRFCCEEMTSACSSYLASFVCDLETAVLLMEYGLEEHAHFLVAACLQVFLRELPSSLHNPNVIRLLCHSESRERLAAVGHTGVNMSQNLNSGWVSHNPNSFVTK